MTGDPTLTLLQFVAIDAPLVSDSLSKLNEAEHRKIIRGGLTADLPLIQVDCIKYISFKKPSYNLHKWLCSSVTVGK